MHKMDKLNDITLSMEVENKINCHIDCVYESENLMRVVGWEKKTEKNTQLYIVQMAIECENI